jgi:glycosyltransferase involved in cell wall biosynthesis
VNRKKILAIAYACNPFKGSEEGVGWGWVNMISQKNDVWVILAEYHRADINRYLLLNPNKCKTIHFCYVQNKFYHYKPSKFWFEIEHSIFKPIMNFAYILWQRDAFILSSRLHNCEKFDLIHLITYVGFRFPGKFWKLNIPFVWGPIGGLENTPWKFLPNLGLHGFVYYGGRNLINFLHRIFLFGPKNAFKKAKNSTISATDSIRKEIKLWYNIESKVICEIGPPEFIAKKVNLRSKNQILRITWSGKHLVAKALPLLLKALSKLPPELNWRLDILGDGPCNTDWKNLASKLEVSSKCYWHGLLPRHKAINLIGKSHLFVITSLKDLTSSVLLESLSQGVPVICPDAFGFATVINENCGLKIPLKSPSQFVEDLSKQILRINSNEVFRRKISRGALMRIKDFSWNNKLLELEKIYRKISSIPN